MRPVPYLLVGGPSAIAGIAIALLFVSRLDHYAAFAGALVAGGLALIWLGVSGRRIGWAGWIAVASSRSPACSPAC